MEARGVDTGRREFKRAARETCKNSDKPCWCVIGKTLLIAGQARQKGERGGWGAAGGVKMGTQKIPRIMSAQISPYPRGCVDRVAHWIL